MPLPDPYRYRFEWCQECERRMEDCECDELEFPFKPIAVLIEEVEREEKEIQRLRKLNEQEESSHVQRSSK